MTHQQRLEVGPLLAQAIEHGGYLRKAEAAGLEVLPKQRHIGAVDEGPVGPVTVQPFPEGVEVARPPLFLLREHRDALTERMVLLWRQVHRLHAARPAQRRL